MTVLRIPRSSGKIINGLINGVLRSSFAPKLDVEPDLIHKSRRNMDFWGSLMPLARGIRVRQQVIESVACELHQPPKTSGERVVLYFHGGGYCVGSPKSHRHVVSQLARETGMRVVVPDYRKSLEHPFPAPIEDALAVYHTLLQRGVKPSNIFFCGDSAGGNLVLSTMLKLKDDGTPLPAAASCISPWTDLTMSGESILDKASLDYLLSHSLLQQFANHYLATHRHESGPLHHHVSPLYGDLSGLPPLLLQVGSHEVLLDDSIRLLEKAIQSGVNAQLQIWEDMQHVWHYSFALLKDGREAIEAIAHFFDNYK